MLIPGFVISLLTFPGVIVHEFAHQLFCKWTGTAVREVCYFQFGKPVGYVIHDLPTSVWRHILIGVGPLVINTSTAFVIGIAMALFHADLERPTLLTGLGAWVAASIGMHSFPSVGDAQAIWKAIWSPDAPVLSRLLGVPVVTIIFVGALASIIWLDLIYGLGVALWIPHAIVG